MRRCGYVLMKAITVRHSNAIRKVVDEVLQELAQRGGVDVTGEGKVAGKAITVVEIAKRRIGEEGGTWYQCNEVGPVLPLQSTASADEFVALQEKQRTVPRLTIHLRGTPFADQGLRVQTNARDGA